MTDASKLVTDIRTAFGKGAARKLRAVGKIPAVLYGHGSEPQHLTLDAHDVFMLVRRSNAIFDLDIEGTSQLALVKDIQRNPVLQGAQAIEHLDLVIVTRGEKVVVDVPIHVEGESAPGTITNLELTSISIEVDAMQIPNNLVVSIDGLEEGAHVLAGGIELPAGATLLTDPEALIIGIMVPAAPQDEAEGAEPTGAGASGEASDDSGSAA